jgi:hypothetical protein
MANVLIGSYTAKLDASGRIKIPEKFREVIEQVYGKDLFVTSLSDDSIKSAARRLAGCDRPPAETSSISGPTSQFMLASTGLARGTSFRRS